MNAERNETRWLALADAVSAGVAIDWDDAEHQAADAEEFEVLRALRSLEDIARVHSTITPERPPTARQTTRQRSLARPCRSRASSAGSIWRCCSILARAPSAACIEPGTSDWTAKSP